MAVSVTICNLALGDLRAPAIQTIADDSIEAQMCERYYPHCLSLMLDDYSWQFLKRIATLAQLVSNERSEEWPYAYALPSDCGQALKLLPSGVAYQTYPDTEYPPQWWNNFIVENNILYSNVSGAKLEYSCNAVEEADMPPLFREALRRLLAANLAIPIRDSRELEADLLKQAEAARQSAMAADMNRAPVREIVEDVGWARR